MAVVVIVMKQFLQRVVQPGSPVASVPLVFFTVTALVLLQLPVNLMMKAGWISAGILTNEIFIIAGLPLLIIWLLHFDTHRLLPFRRPTALVVGLVVLATLGADIVIDYLTVASESVFPMPKEVVDAIDSLMSFSSTTQFFWKLVVLCIVPAVCEEIFFRGYCQGSLRAKWGPATALVVASLIFALLHGNPWLIHLYFLLGLLMGLIYEITGTLWAPIICHVFNNGWTFINNARDFSFPIGNRVGLVDIMIFLVGLIVFSCAIVLLRKQMVGLRKSRSHP
jgi:membrane protease YdiL (CAAX protease family)